MLSDMENIIYSNIQLLKSSYLALFAYFHYTSFIRDYSDQCPNILCGVRFILDYHSHVHQSLTNLKWITPPKLVYVYIDGRFITAKEMRSERIKGGLLMELFDHFTEIVALKWWWWWWWTCQVEAWHEIRFN